MCKMGRKLRSQNIAHLSWPLGKNVFLDTFKNTQKLFHFIADKTFDIFIIQVSFSFSLDRNEI